jgi:hypothetical protein
MFDLDRNIYRVENYHSLVIDTQSSFVTYVYMSDLYLSRRKIRVNHVTLVGWCVTLDLFVRERERDTPQLAGWWLNGQHQRL